MLRSGRIGRGGSGTDRAQETEDHGISSAEWIEFEIRAPGEPSHSIRREVFDLLGPAARAGSTASAPQISETSRLERGLALMGQTQILAIGNDLSPEFVCHQMALSLLASRPQFVGDDAWR
jgi:hypothetical protein